MSRAITFPKSGVQKLGRKELGILAYLNAHPGQVITRKALIHSVWGIHADVKSRSLDQYVVKVRDLFESDPRNRILVADRQEESAHTLVRSYASRRVKNAAADATEIRATQRCVAKPGSCERRPHEVNARQVGTREKSGHRSEAFRQRGFHSAGPF